MSIFKFANNVSTTLASAITTTSQTTIVLASSANLPTLTGGAVMALTLNDAATGLVFEIVYVTAITGATLTVVRGQEGTAATTWLVNDIAYATDTAGTLANFALANVSGAIAIDTSSTAQVKVGTLTLDSAITFATGGTALASTSVGIVNDGAGVAGMVFNVPTSSTNGWRWRVNGSTVATLNSLGALTLNALTLPAASVNGLLMTPLSDTQAGTFVITNSAATNELLQMNHINSTTGQLSIVGNLVCWPGGTYSTPNPASGDIVAQRSTVGGAIYLGGSADSGTADFGINNANSFSFRRTSTGYATCYGLTFTNTSDATLKENVAEIQYGLATVRTLTPRSFDWIAGGKHDLGFIAQEVLPIIPEIVSTDNEGIHGVNYSGIIPVLVKALQELAAEVDALKAA